MHVTDPDNFPAAPTAPYAPHAALLPDALSNAVRLHLPNLVLVQPSTYGTDNACLLSALSTLGPSRGRGVIAFEQGSVSHQNLSSWHQQGVRGVRINLKSGGGGSPTPEQLEQQIRTYDEEMKRFPEWVIEVFVELDMMPALANIVERLGERKVVVAHLGTPPPGAQGEMEGVPGWRDLVGMVRKRQNFYVKVSAPYRAVKGKDWGRLEGMVKELYGAAMEGRAGEGLVFASDWPHTRFEGVEVEPWVGLCLEWCDGDEALARKLFRENAEVLWDVDVKKS